MMDHLSGNAADAVSPGFKGSGIAYSIKPRDSRALLELSGDLRVGWTASLALGLTRRDISIVSGKAVKKGALCWSSHFELEPAGNRPGDLTTLDVDSFFRGAADYSSLPEISLNRFHLELCERHNGSLYVEINGGDTIGFLAGVMRLFSYYSLFPVEMEIETRGKTAHDRFWLKCIGNVPPLPEDAECVRKRLAGLTGS